ncbi:hypothetical protein [Crateriforma conspicua]|uniref:3-keto-disaccharide hydrolase domain-containing protein n=1 Tax=Crateriforma conspicua TaxID=2527996 RepID=A0A5C6FSY9_9PLAN|nr:hypothetical protein [Crateriforma conspicua]TWU64675.1 hypothetical protein V7x_02190 [Crateriforma conspicua]
MNSLKLIRCDSSSIHGRPSPLNNIATIFTSIAMVTLVPHTHAAESKVICVDSFERRELGPDLRSMIPDFRIEDGVLKGRQRKPDHGGSAHRPIQLPNGNVRIELRFNFQGARSFNLSCDDRSCQKVHAGHIARITVQPNRLTLFDDKEGVMRLDIRKLRKSGDPEKRAEGDRLSADATARFPLSLQQDRWYQLRLEIVADVMKVWIDGKLAGNLKSAGLKHPTKPDLRIGVWGSHPSHEVHFDDLRVHSIGNTVP